MAHKTYNIFSPAFYRKSLLTPVLEHSGVLCIREREPCGSHSSCGVGETLPVGWTVRRDVRGQGQRLRETLLYRLFVPGIYNSTLAIQILYFFPNNFCGRFLFVCLFLFFCLGTCKFIKPRHGTSSVNHPVCDI